MNARNSDRILIVDDDGDEREALAEFLRVNGYAVDCAENGRAAFDWIGARNEPPRLIVLDLAMPVMDGYAFIDHARSDPRIRDVPIVVVTAYPPEEAPPAATVVSKPIKPETFLPIVRRMAR